MLRAALQTYELSEHDRHIVAYSLKTAEKLLYQHFEIIIRKKKFSPLLCETSLDHFISYRDCRTHSVAGALLLLPTVSIKTLNTSNI